ncbi:amidase [Alteribacillus sp. JSM 102045]|uniref:amidase n=1 Tax=Alteribacillus sp. JSM 102045 TaxID=1562101 RepID=UPI0035BFF692
MSVKKPTVQQLETISKEFHLNLEEEDIAFYLQMIERTLSSYNRLNQLSEPSLPVNYPRNGGYRPSEEENPYNAWYWKAEVKGEKNGPLAGKSIVLKDNISLAGVPMMNGSAILEGYIPNEDATVVNRILEAGATIAGKAVCEDLCLSGGSHTSANGPVLNPHNTDHSTGGSSSGSAALVAAGEVDMAIGGDQGGSIRMPSSWCGIYGLKPTYGLVPYTGIMPIEQTIDHTGPMARSVEDVALLLDVLAGDNGLDPRQSGLGIKNYSKALTESKSILKIGIVREGFEWDVSEEDVSQKVKETAAAIKDYGASVEEVSIPMHSDGIHIWNGIGIEGLTSMMIKENGMGTNWKGHYSTNLLDYYGKSRKVRADEYSETVKMSLLLGQYLQEQYNGKFYAKAQNLSRALRSAYDEVFEKYDILIMPTTPMKATKLPAGDATREEVISKALGMIQNTAPFNVTGHPAMNVPCGKSNGLPVGMMLVGRHGMDDQVLKAAFAYQSLQNPIEVPKG